MYKVFRVSENTNSFGLKQFYAMNKDGIVFRACKYSEFAPKVGQLVDFNGSYELKEVIGEAPSEVQKEVWN